MNRILSQRGPTRYSLCSPWGSTYMAILVDQPTPPEEASDGVFRLSVQLFE